MPPTSVHYPYAYRTVFDSVCAVLPRLGYQIVSADPATGVIQAGAGMSVLSWGENILVRIGSGAAGDTEVLVTSGLKFGLVDWGKNQQNISRIHADLAQYVAWLASQGGAPA